jgi:hypothetical protein
MAINLPLLGCHLQGEGSSTEPRRAKDEGRQGAVLPYGRLRCHHPTPPPLGRLYAVETVSPPWEGTSSYHLHYLFLIFTIISWQTRYLMLYIIFP